MRKRVLIFLFVLIYSLQSFGQLTTSNLPPYNTPQHLIQNVLLGSGVSAFNVQVYGAPIQYGFFSGGGTSIGLDSGIVLISDDINQIPIPPGIPGTIPNPSPTSGSFGPPSMGTTTNNDLLSVANSVPPLISQTFSVGSVNDAVVLEFDFVPVADTIEFRYVFGSDEYLTFVNTQYNDVFAFLLSGPGITGPYTSPPGFPGGSKNLAIVPNSTPALPITISSVNNVLNNAFYINNQPNTGLSVNGYTTVLTAKHAVNACDTFHIRLAIGDGTDAALQSCVFLEANSFAAKGVSIVASPTYNTIGGDSILFEGCGSVDFTINRSGGIQNLDTVFLNLTGTAVNGVDYSTVPPFLVFQPGIDSVAFSINVTNDQINEGLEDLIISVSYQTQCSFVNTDTLELFISDPIPIQNIISNDTTINCTDGPVTLSNQTIGLFPFKYLWNSGDTTTQITTDSGAVYVVKITDECKVDSLYDTVVVTNFTPPFSTIDQSDTINCGVDSVLIGTKVINGYPQITHTWNNGKTDSAIWVSSTKDTSFYVNVELTCDNQLKVDTFHLVVENPPFSLSMKNDTLDCTIDSIKIAPRVNGIINGFSYQWQNGKSDSAIWVSPNQIQTYKVVVTDACGINSDSIVNTVFYETSPMTLTTNSPSFDCLGDSVDMVVSVIGGYPGYKFLWSSGGTNFIERVAPKTTSTYIVRVTDTCGIDTVIGIVEVTQKKWPKLNIQNIPNPELNCPGDTVVLGPALATGGSGDNAVSWNNFADTVRTLIVSTDSTAFYLVKAKDFCNLDSAQRLVSVRIAKHDPFRIITSPDTTICEGEQAQLWAQPKGGAGNFQYYWSTANVDSSILVNPQFTAAYSVSITDDCDNMVFDNIRVRISNPNADFNYQYIEDRTVKMINLSTNDAENFFWNFGASDTSSLKEPTFNIENSLEFPVKLVIENIYGCKDSTFLEIVPPLKIYAPNSFTPNEDGLNDQFEIVTEGVNNFNFWIFDRWGNEIFHSIDPYFSWNGTNKQGNVVQGVYAYRLEVEGFNKQVVEKMGTILLLKN